MLGSIFDSLFSNAGYEVVFRSRGKHLNTMIKLGLTIEGSKETYKTNKGFIVKPFRFSDVDVILFYFKSNNTRERTLELKLKSIQKQLF